MGIAFIGTKCITWARVFQTVRCGRCGVLGVRRGTVGVGLALGGGVTEVVMTLGWYATRYLQTAYSGLAMSLQSECYYLQ